MKKEKQAGEFCLLDIISNNQASEFAVKKIVGGHLILYSLTNGVTLANTYDPERLAELGYRVTGKATKRDIRR